MKKQRILAWMLLIGLIMGGWLAQPVRATSTEPEETAAEATGAAEETEAVEETEAKTQVTEIRTPQQLQDMAKDPAGSYILMEDLDMTGFEWKPVDFTGSFDGNGHAILNLELSQPGDETADTYDGNLKVYESSFVGLFGTLRGAGVKNLKLLGVHGVVDTDTSCFMGGIAGYADKCTITDCTVTGPLELRAHDRMFGVGGLVGYGGGIVKRCDVDVTLICTDTDEMTRDEQFLGGILGMGFMDIQDCNMVIDGYISDYGYVHSGGLIGMLLRYPIGDWTCSITGNSVTGKITFFECNWDRRAYCKAIVGEYMSSYRVVEDNTEDFKVDERFEYDVELRPEMCEEPEYRDTVVAGDCYNYGYTSHMCQICGYTYKDTYTALEHVPVTWTVTEEPTTEKEGLSVGYCECGLAVEEQVLEKLEPEPTEPPTEPETVPTETVPPETEPVVEETKSGGFVVFIVIGVVVVVAALVIIGFLAVKKNQTGKYLR